jgi:hypothetical protein
VLLGNRTASSIVFGGVPSVTLKNNGCFIGSAQKQMAIDKVETGVSLTTGKPLVVGRRRFI